MAVAVPGAGPPASLIGIFAFFYLKDKPEQAGWLTPSEKASLRNHLDNDAHTVATASHGSMWALLRDPKVYSMSLVYFLLLGATYTLIFWVPTLIRGWGVQDVSCDGLLTMVPSLFGIVGMVLLSRSSESTFRAALALLRRHGDQRAGVCDHHCHAGQPGRIAGRSVRVGNRAVGGHAGYFAALSEYMPKKTAAAGIALISSLGNLGPAVMPTNYDRDQHLHWHAGGQHVPGDRAVSGCGSDPAPTGATGQRGQPAPCNGVSLADDHRLPRSATVANGQP